jgi:3-hydroxyacyl-[acyl-carrier-protein] dehydratase
MRLEYFQMVDRIIVLDPEARLVRAACQVPDDSPVFEGHFPGHPILPGVLMLEAMAQTGGWLLLATRRFASMPFLIQVREGKMRGFVAPGQALEAEAHLVHDGSGYAVMEATLREAGGQSAGGKKVAEAELRYRVVPFPNETLRTRMLESARRIGVSETFLDAA